MKKNLKKLASIAIAVVMMMAMMIPALAAQVAGDEQDPATITLTNAAIGESYNVYRVFGAEVNSTNNIAYYTLLSGTEVPEALSGVFTATNNTVVKNADATDEAITAALNNWLKTATPLLENVVAAQDTIEFKVPYGYYVVTNTAEAKSTLTVTSTTPDVEIIDKNESKPTIDPVNGKTVDKESAAIGETVTYTLKFNAVNFVTEENDGKVETKAVRKYILTDTLPPELSNVTITSITVGGKKWEAAPTQFDNKRIEITWPMTIDGEAVKNGAEVVVTYTARVNGTVNDKIENTVTLSYVTDGGEVPVNPENPPKAEVKTYSIDIAKTNNSGALLNGAEFALYTGAEGGEALALVDLGNGNYRLADTEDATTTTTIVLGEDGIAKISGLRGKQTAENGTTTNGVYYLEETKAPAGYNALTARQMVTVIDSNLDVTTTDGNYTSGGVQVINQTGAELPSTGGIGTTMFYVIGGILVVAAGVLLVTKKRMSTEG